MRVLSVSATNVLSFESLDLDFPAETTVLVGPSGSGKSNVLRLFDLVIQGLQYAERTTQAASEAMGAFLESRFLGQGDIPAHVALEIELTADHERHALTRFVHSAVYTALVGNWAGQENDAIVSWIQREIADVSLRELWRGTLVVEHPGPTDERWDVSYLFSRGGVSYRWPMGSTGNRQDITEATPSSLAPRRSVTVARRLLGEDLAHPPTAPSMTWDLGMLLPSEAEVVHLTTDPRGTPLATPHREFLSAQQLPTTGSTPSYTLGLPLLKILRDGIVRTSDARLLPLGISPLSHDDETAQRLPETLFHLKNGPTRERRRYDAIRTLFATLTGGRRLESGRLGASGAPDTHVIRVSVDSDFEVLVQFAGAGAWEALVLATALAGREGSVIVLDEPAVALHATLQRSLLSILARMKAQVIIVTHSPYLLPFHVEGHRTQIVRIARKGHSSRTWTVHPSSLRGIATKLRGKGNDHILFSESVILCEGQDDVDVIVTIDDRLKLGITERNVSVVDCGGRESIPDYVVFCSSLGIPQLVIIDGDGSKQTDVAVHKKVSAVRATVADNKELATILEFPEDIEHAFRRPTKGREHLLLAARDLPLDTGEPARLVAALRRLLDGEVPFAVRRRKGD